jgi:hypothetical protein
MQVANQRHGSLFCFELSGKSKTRVGNQPRLYVSSQWGFLTQLQGIRRQFFRRFWALRTTVQRELLLNECLSKTVHPYCACQPICLQSRRSFVTEPDMPWKWQITPMSNFPPFYSSDLGHEKAMIGLSSRDLSYSPGPSSIAHIDFIV